MLQLSRLILSRWTRTNALFLPHSCGDPKKGEFRPKQSLGQNYLSDQNYVMKICNHFGDTSEGGRRVLELGPGTGALTQVRVGWGGWVRGWVGWRTGWATGLGGMVHLAKNHAHGDFDRGRVSYSSSENVSVSKNSKNGKLVKTVLQFQVAFFLEIEPPYCHCC